MLKPLASIHQPIGSHTPALHQHNSALWVAFSAKPNRRLYCQSHVYTTNIDCGNACGQPLPMRNLSLAVPGQMPKCSSWCQFRYDYYYYYYCCWPACWIYYPLRIDNRPIIFVLGRSFRFFLHLYICSPARRLSSERIILLFIVYVFGFSFYELF